MIDASVRNEKCDLLSWLKILEVGGLILQV